MSNNAFTSNFSNGMWLTTIPHRISGFKESYAWITKFRVNNYDSISKIEERISDKYFCNFLSIYQIFCFLEFFFEVGIFYC